MRLSRTLAVPLFLLAAAARPSLGQSVTAGSENTGNCYPFSCLGDGGLYQQVYAASLFGTTPFSISSITFFAAVYAANGQSFDLRLSTTTRGVGALSTDLPENVGADAQMFANFTPTGAVANSLTILGNAFQYDPNAGNLLLEVFVHGTSRLGNQPFAADAESKTLSRALDYDGDLGGALGTRDRVGLVTQFDAAATNVTATPEPATMTLMATGIAGLAGFVRKRRRV